MLTRKTAAKPLAKAFTATLEHLNNNLGWIIARVPVEASKAWGTRAQLRVKGEINGFAFGTTLFPDGKGGHFLLVNKKLQAGGKTRPGLNPAAVSSYWVCPGRIACRILLSTIASREPASEPQLRKARTCSLRSAA